MGWKVLDRDGYTTIHEWNFNDIVSVRLSENISWRLVLCVGGEEVKLLTFYGGSTDDAKICAEDYLKNMFGSFLADLEIG